MYLLRQLTVRPIAEQYYACFNMLLLYKMIVLLYTVDKQLWATLLFLIYFL